MRKFIEWPGPLVGFFAALMVLFVLLRPLLPVDETRYLAVAWEMWLTGDLFHLTRNFDLYAHKPPLLFWLVDLVWHVVGVSEFAARLVAPAFGVATVVATGALARTLWPEDERIAARSVAVLSGFTVFLLYASATMFDTMLSLATLAGIAILWLIGRGNARPILWVGFGAALAFGIYAKGPVILLHVLPAFLMLRLWAPAPPAVRQMVPGLLLSLATGGFLVALWLGPALLSGDGAYRHELIWTQTAGRVAGGLAHDRPVWFFLALLPVLLFPWAWSRGLWGEVRRLIRTDAASRLLVVWAGAGLLLFSFVSGKQAHYLLPEFPAVALLVARAIGGATKGHPPRAIAPVLLACGGIIALALWAVPAMAPATGTYGPILAASGVICLGLAVTALRLSFVGANLLAGMGLAIAVHTPFVATPDSAGFDAGSITATIAQSRDHGLAVSGMTYNAEFNFADRLSQPVAVLGTAAEIRSWGISHPGGLLFGPVGLVPVPVPPVAETRYNGLELGFWPAEAVAVTSPE